MLASGGAQLWKLKACVRAGGCAVLAPKLKPDPPVWGVLSGVVLAKGEALLWKLKAGAKVFVVLLLLLQAAKLKPPIWEGAVPAVGRLVIRM
jgi:hypothetical protein